MKKIKKIILFYPSFEKGGATKVLFNLLNFLFKKKIFVELISVNANYSDFKLSNKYLKIPKLKNKPTKIFFSNRIIYALSLANLLIESIIKSNKANTLVFSMQSHFISTIISKLYDIKIIVRNSEDPFGATKYADERFFSIFTFFSKFITFNLADKIITNSSKSLNSIKFFLLNKKNARLILNPYISKVNFKIGKINIKKKNQLLAIGRLTKQKNFEFLINAFYEFSKTNKYYKLIIIGSGSDRKKLKKKIDDLNISKRIKIINWKNNLKPYFNVSKIFILPSLYEGLPNILIEAISNGIPCISSNCSGSIDILKNNKSGLIFPINNKNLLIDHINQIINNYCYYENEAKKFIKSSKRFLIDSQSKKYLRYFKSL